MWLILIPIAAAIFQALYPRAGNVAAWLLTTLFIFPFMTFAMGTFTWGVLGLFTGGTVPWSVCCIFFGIPFSLLICWTVLR